MRHWIGLLTALAIGGCAAGVIPASAIAAANDTPPLIAGRVAAIDGDVNIWRAEEDGGGQWDRAQLNDVVTVGTGLATGDGRVEVRIGPHALRLGAGSSGGFGRLGYDAKSFTLERGVANIRLAPVQQAESVAVLVADVSVTLAAPGRYRIGAIDGAPLDVTVFEGQAIVQRGANSVTVGAGQALAMTQSSMSFGAAASTALDDWALARDQRTQDVLAARYVSPYMTGYEELDGYGDWLTDTTYGTVWVPRVVPVGWAPYRDGRWRWISPWGWTWIDAAPWGYAPFHYGRWVTIGSRWCWWPGGYVARPVWAPALVGFVGAGGASFALGGPAVGWYPLAPWHPYRPYYRAPTNYVTIINQTVIQRPPGVPRNVNQHPGSTWVPGPSFREPIAKVHIPAQSAKVADLQPMAPPARPRRTAPVGEVPASAVPGDRTVPPARPAPKVMPPPPKYSASPYQPRTAAEPSPQQPAPYRRVEPRPQPSAPVTLPEREAPRPRPKVPAETLPPSPPQQRSYPGEPVRTPQGVPPAARQPMPAPPAASRMPPTVAQPGPPQAAPPGQLHRGPAPAEPPRGGPPTQPGTPAQHGVPAQHDAPAVRAPKPDIPPPKPVAQ